MQIDPARVERHKRLHRMLFWTSVVLFGVLLIASLFTSYALPFALVDLVWFVLGIRIVPTKERWVITMFEDPYDTVESGIIWLPFLISSAKQFPTEPVQLDFPEEVLVITKPGKVDGDDKTTYGTTTLRGEVSLMFRCPQGAGLLRAAKILPNPKDKEALIDYFQEPVFEEVRTIGGDFVYIDLLRKKGQFAEDVTKALREKDGVIKFLTDEAGIENPQVLIKVMEPPAEIMKALSAEEGERLLGRATRVKADAEADRERSVGKGKADAKRELGKAEKENQQLLYDMIREHPENIAIRSLYTLSEMAQGPATTIFPISTNLADMLRDVLGKSRSLPDLEKVWENLPQNLKDAVTLHMTNTLKPQTPKGGKP